jgi:hypothetical protein
MKINRLETHDRLLHLIKDQSKAVAEGAEDCLKKNPTSLALQSKSPYIYIYGHARTADDGVNKKLFWQARLEKPAPESNSYLFRAQSNTDLLETCWILPPHETWDQYKKENVVASEIVGWSIHQYKTNRLEMAKPFPDDMSKEQIKRIYLEIATEMEQDQKMKKMSAKPETLEPYQTV